MVASLIGCNTVPAEKYQATQRELQQAREQVRGLEDQIARQQQSLGGLEKQLAELRGLSTPQLFEQLVFPEQLTLASLSGPYDTDAEPGDDGIALFIQPIDRDGHVVKAAGTLKITLLDPLSPPNRNVVATYLFDVPGTRKLWYGRLWTQHFSVRCPWPTGQIPVHDEITAHVIFTDLLTGRSLTTQQPFKIQLPPKLDTTTP